MWAAHRAAERLVSQSRLSRALSTTLLQPEQLGPGGPGCSRVKRKSRAISHAKMHFLCFLSGVGQARGQGKGTRILIINLQVPFAFVDDAEGEKSDTKVNC